MDKDDHLMECLYRLVLEGLYHIPPSFNNSPVFDEAMTDSLDIHFDIDGVGSSGAIDVFE